MKRGVAVVLVLSMLFVSCSMGTAAQEVWDLAQEILEESQVKQDMLAETETAKQLAEEEEQKAQLEKKQRES